MLSDGQINLLLARLNAAGYASERAKYDWLYENDVNVNDFSQLAQLTQMRLHDLLNSLMKETV